MATYYTILTTIGQAKIANAVALSQMVDWTEMAVGDGNGNPTTPSESQTALVNEVYRAGINQLTVDEENPNYIVAELVIPTNVGGWAVNEVGIFDDDGDLVAVANFPATYKPVLAEGSGRDLVVRIIIQVSNASVVQLKVDPAIVLASQKWVIDNFVKKTDHATEAARGIIEIADNAEATALADDQRALTPKKLDVALKGGNAEAATPAQFDNSGKIATTEFVRRQGLQSSGFFALNGATTLTAQHAGASVFLGGTTNYTVTLPLASTMTPGARIEFFFSSTAGTQTIQRQGSDIIYLGGAGTYTSVSGAIGDSITFVTNGANWYAVSGSLQMGKASAFGNFMNVNGYQKLPSGLIIQWAQATVTEAGTQIIFPIAFPNAAFALAAMDFGLPANRYVQSYGNLTNTGFMGYGGGPTDVFTYIAIGW